MKTWFKELFAKTKAGIVWLYGNSWFNGLSSFALGTLLLCVPTLGAILWFVWLAGWLFLAEK